LKEEVLYKTENFQVRLTREENGGFLLFGGIFSLFFVPEKKTRR